jgi:hypothetical protein
MKKTLMFLMAGSAILMGCDSAETPLAPAADDAAFALAESPEAPAMALGNGVQTANGWYEGEEIYYLLLGVEEGVSTRGENDLYLIGGNRMYQANVAEFIPGEAGYSPHWIVNVVHTAEGVTLADILTSGYASEHYGDEGVLFDDVGDIRAAEADGLVTIDMPGVVVLCPIISEEAAEAPGNTALSEDFPSFPDSF